MAYVINHEEVSMMPGRDGTGPAGAGAMTGRGMGLCPGAAGGGGSGFGPGLACRRGFGSRPGRHFPGYGAFPKMEKDLLEKQRNLLRARIEMIDRQLKSL